MVTASVIEWRLRRLLLLLTFGICGATIAELLLNEHTQETVQFVPLVVATLGILSTGAVFIRPNPTTLRFLRGVAVLMIVASLAGIGFHLRGNFSFELEIRPNAAFTDVIMDALMGAAPLLAPGVLALGGILALATTYYHPALGKRAAET